jgi:hypothetical protein
MVASVVLARMMYLRKFGMATEASTPRIAMTIINSMRVKPLLGCTCFMV